MESTHTITQKPKTSLVIETTNLRGGGANRERQIASLERLLEHLTAQTYSLSRLWELTVTHYGVDRPVEERLERAAGRPIEFVALSEGADYYQAKNRGFDSTTGDVVIFADSDCWPDPDWLEQLLAPFEDPAVEVVAGRTTYRDDTFGRAASAVDFLYFINPRDARATLNFYANNVAFRRGRFAEHRFPDEPEIYRGACQLLGLRLFEGGIDVRFQDTARTIHRFPDSRRELLALRLMRGRDLLSLAPQLAETYAPARLRFVRRLPRIAAGCAHAIRFNAGARALAGESVRTYAALAGISALDAIGSFVIGLGPRVLSYHSG